MCVIQNDIDLQLGRIELSATNTKCMAKNIMSTQPNQSLERKVLLLENKILAQETDIKMT